MEYCLILSQQKCDLKAWLKLKREHDGIRATKLLPLSVASAPRPCFGYCYWSKISAPSIPKNCRQSDGIVMQNDHIKLHKQMAKKSPDTTITYNYSNWNVDLKPLNFGQLANHNLSCGEGMPNVPFPKQSWPKMIPTKASSRTMASSWSFCFLWVVFVRESTMGMEVQSKEICPSSLKILSVYEPYLIVILWYLLYPICCLHYNSHF